MKTKILYPAFLLLLLTIACNKQVPVSINGKLSNVAAGSPVYFEELEYNEVRTLDTTLLKGNGQFEFSEFISHPGLYRVRYQGNHSVFLVLDKENPKVEIEADTVLLFQKPYTVRGSSASNQFLDFFLQVNDKYKAINATGQMLGDTSAQLTDSMKQVLFNQLQTITEQAHQWLSAYIDTLTNPVIAVFGLSNFMSPQNDEVLFKKFVSKAKTEYINVPMVNEFVIDVESAFKKMNRQSGESLYTNGTSIPEISLPDQNGEVISLSSLRGKWVLVDFWASWCGPCREENPNLVAAWKKYNDKGFTIFSVSLDEEKEKWQKAISKDKLDWPHHASDLKGWESTVVEQFGLQQIPSNYLIDPQGIIIASNLRGRELENILADKIK